MHTKPSTSTNPPKPKTLNCKSKQRKRRRRHSNNSNSSRNRSRFLHQSSKSAFQPQQWHCQGNIHQLQMQPELNHHSTSFDMWRKTYETILSWQSEHQANYWRNQANNFRNVNLKLWNKLKKYENDHDLNESSSDSSENEEIYETSSEDDNDNNDRKQDHIDEDYLKFLEVTQKHREDYRMSNQSKMDENIT